MEYIQIPIRVEARQLKEDGSNAKELAAWIDHREGWMGLHFEGANVTGVNSDGSVTKGIRIDDIIIVFDPYEVQHTASPGDWIVYIDGVFKIYDNYNFEKRFVKSNGEEMHFKCLSREA